MIFGKASELAALESFFSVWVAPRIETIDWQGRSLTARYANEFIRLSEIVERTLTGAEELPDLYRQGRFNKALETFEKVLDADPKHPFAATNAGLCLEVLGRPREACVYYRKALEVSPDLEWTNRARERLLRLEGDDTDEGTFST